MATYRMTDPVRNSADCPLCNDGWPRWVSDEGGPAHHDLPEPAGTFTCYEVGDLVTSAVGVMAFPDWALVPAGVALFDDRELARRACWLLVPGCPWWVGPALSATVVFLAWVILT